MADYADHNSAAASLGEAYRRDEHDRVPITLAFDEQFILHHFGLTFEQYYGDVGRQIETQLRSREWICEEILQDAAMGLPDSWSVTPPSWMEENEFYGAEIEAQENDYWWGKPLPLSKAELLAHLQGLDVEQQICGTTFFRQFEEMRDRVKGLEYRGRPVHTPAVPLGGTHGIFTKAAEIRGVDRICLDLCEDPAFVRELLETVTELTIARIRCWHELCGSEATFPTAGGWSCADDSLVLISRRHYEEFVLPCHERIYSAMTTGVRGIHLCGHVQRLFGALHRRLGVTIFDGPGTQVDIPAMIRDIGERVTIQAQVSHAILGGSRRGIEEAVSGVLSEDAKAGARMTLLGYAPRAAPLENIRFFYECGRRHGELPAR